MSFILFEDKTHTYKNREGEDFKSVSKKFKPFKPVFDNEFICARSVYKNLIPIHYERIKKKYNNRDSKTLGYEDKRILKDLSAYLDEKDFKTEYNRLQKEWKDKNIKAVTKGTAFHNLKEHLDIDRGYTYSNATGAKYKTILTTREGDNSSIKENLFDLEDGYYTELVIHYEDDNVKVAGQADRVFIYTICGVRYVDIDDWKTDESINLVPDFYHPYRGYETLLKEFSHLVNSNYSAYTLKISAYAKMMEYFGFVPNRLGFTSVCIDDDLNVLSKKYYKIPYRRYEADILIKS